MANLVTDLAYAVRLLRRDRAPSVASIGILALGIGAALAIVSILDVVFFRPVPHPHSEQLFQVDLEIRAAEDTTQRTSPSMAELRHWLSTTGAFSHIAAWRFGSALVIDDGSGPRRLKAAQIRHVTERYFEMLGIHPLGRPFTAADTADGTDSVVMLGHGYWQRRFGGDPGAIGRIITLQSERATIIGVLPPGFHQGEDAFQAVELWLPLRRSSLAEFVRDTGWHVIGRLRFGRDPTAAAMQLTEASAGLAEQVRDLPTATVRLTPLAETAMLDVNFRSLALLSWAATMILVLACVNVAGLLVARSIVRTKEVMIRASLGASRIRLLRQLLTETVLLSLIGGALGVALAWLGVNLIVANVVALLPVNTEATLEFRTLAVAVGLTIVVGALVGWVPALRLSGVEGAGLMRSDRTPRAQLTSRIGRWLVGVQVALAIVLLNCAGVMLRNVMGLLATDPGFDPDRCVLVRISPIDDAAGKKAADYLPAVLQSIRELPQVEAAGAIDRASTGPLRQTGSAGGLSTPVSVRRVVPGFFEALGAPLRQGRLPSTPDLTAAVPRAIVSDALAKHLFAGRSAVGELLEMGKIRPEVIGVVGDVNYAAPTGSAQPEIYLITGQTFAGYNPLLVVRVRGSATTLEHDIRRSVQNVAPGFVVDELQTFTQHLWSFEAVGVRRQQMTMLGVLAGVALLLALVGVFSVSLNAVASRKPEVAVRLALGETPSGVVRLVVRDTMKAVATGVIIGFAATVPASRLVEGLLFQTSPIDATTVATVAAAMAGAALAAAWLPSRQMGRLDPAVILKAE